MGPVDRSVRTSDRRLSEPRSKGVGSLAVDDDHVLGDGPDIIDHDAVVLGTEATNYEGVAFGSSEHVGRTLVRDPLESAMKASFSDDRHRDYATTRESPTPAEQLDQRRR